VRKNLSEPRADWNPRRVKEEECEEEEVEGGEKIRKQ